MGRWPWRPRPWTGRSVRHVCGERSICASVSRRRPRGRGAAAPPFTGPAGGGTLPSSSCCRGREGAGTFRHQVGCGRLGLGGSGWRRREVPAVTRDASVRVGRGRPSKSPTSSARAVKPATGPWWGRTEASRRRVETPGVEGVPAAPQLSRGSMANVLSLPASKRRYVRESPARHDR